MTITLAKGEGNGNFYHIEVHFIGSHSLVVLYHSSKIRKNNILLENNEQNCDNLCGSKFAGQSIFSFAYLMRSHVRSQELYERTMTMEDTYQVKITLQLCAPNGDSNSLT